MLEEYKHAKGYKVDTEMTAEDLKILTVEFQKVYRKEMGADFPQDPFEQIRSATEAVFGSWNGKRAIDYRRATNIPDDLGTAVNIVAMVFGNMGDDSGTGVAFTRNPATGERKMYGDYLLNAQGEDVVAGIRNTPKIENLANDMPEAYATSWRSARSSNCITKTCRMWNSPLNTANCGCCRPVMASAPPRPPLKSLWTWRAKA